ncbi:tetratricopeptide repeat protein [Arenibacter latericius]|uniref:tetratricopeptide repeat protein n=1 Tax=Arenibacter latericius TaxID=86104 RepID=UPI00040C432F|nr:tetratricopeptide repeat protein [Arenibacter latericius]
MKSKIISGLLILITLCINSALLAQEKSALDYNLDYVGKVKRYFESGNWEAGKNTIQEGLKIHPTDSDLIMLLGKYNYHKGQLDEARYQLNRALVVNPNNIDAKQILVNVEVDSKRYSSAICYVNEILEIRPYWRDLWSKKIELYELQNNHIEAKRLRKRLNQIYPNDKELKKDYLYGLELEAHHSRIEGELDEAIALSKKLLKEDTQREDYYINVVNDHLKAGDPYIALTYVERGLNQFPKSTMLIYKKAGILADQNRYSELLNFLQQNAIYDQYNYYLKEAARNAKESEPAVLYGKVFLKNLGDKEAFSYIFNDALGKQQYQEALNLLNKHRQAVGASKELSVKELAIYNLMGNDSKVASLTKELFFLYPMDSDIKEAYVNNMLQEGKDKMLNERYTEAIKAWEQVSMHSDLELKRIAKTSIFNASLAQGNYKEALKALNELDVIEPGNKDLLIKRAELYFQQKKYQDATSAYEQAINFSEGDNKSKNLIGYADMVIQIINSLNHDFRYNEAFRFVKKWLEVDPDSQSAYHYAIRFAHLTGDDDALYKYAKRGDNRFPKDVFFKIKLAEIDAVYADVEKYGEIYKNLLLELKANRYNQDLINAFTQLTEKYTLELIKNNLSEISIGKIDTALSYSPSNKSLKHIKGLAYEKVKKYDSAYYYQSYYEPSIMESEAFIRRQNYLKYKTYKNQLSLNLLGSNHGDQFSMNTLSTIEYSRLDKRDTYIGRVNYAGKLSGKGVQVQSEWLHDWNEESSTLLNVALSNQFFPEITINASLYKYLKFLNGVQYEIGVGYRKLSEDIPEGIVSNKDLYNIVGGISKEWDEIRLNMRLNGLILDKSWLYNFSLDARYFFYSPKNYFTVVGSLGSSPEIELVDYQMHSGFSVLNTMLGAGYQWNLYKNLYGGILGTWYNYKGGEGNSENQYKNLYNLYFNINVAF